MSQQLFATILKKNFQRQFEQWRIQNLPADWQKRLNFLAVQTMKNTSPNSSFKDAPLLNLLNRPLSEMSTEELRAHLQNLREVSNNIASPLFTARPSSEELPPPPSSQKQSLSHGCARVAQCKDDLCDEYIVCDECDSLVLLEDLCRGLPCPCGHIFDKSRIYEFLGEDPPAERCCAKCNRQLGSEPAILIDDECYCFTDAKRMYPKLEAARKKREEHLNAEHEEAREKYNQSVAAEDSDMRAWKHMQSSFVEDNDFTKWKWIGYVLAIILSFMVNPALGILVTFLGVFVVWIVDDRVQCDRAEQFINMHPPPDLKIQSEGPPKYKWIPGLILAVCDSNNSTDQIGVGYDRSEILKRDNCTCQNCGKRFQEELLEVHHVTPKSKGGSDSIRNLTTLCLKCHMMEDWFGHFHKNKRDFGL